MSTVDLSRLPAPNVVESLDFSAILAERKAAFIRLFPAEQQAEVAKTLSLESEPLTKLLQENSYRELVLRQRVNDGARAVMLAFAKGSDLEQIAANYKVARLTITPANYSVYPPIEAVMEDDDSLRERTQQAFEGLSVAGPRNAYIFHARSADGRVADASAITPAPCEAVVSVLSTIGNGTAPADLIDVVRKALSDDDVRPLGDRLTVQSAGVVNYRIQAVLYMEQGPEVEPIMSDAEKRIRAYCTQSRRLGRDINRSAITAALHAEGVKKVVLIEPSNDIVIDDTQAAFCTGINMSNGGANG